MVCRWTVTVGDDVGHFPMTFRITRGVDYNNCLMSFAIGDRFGSLSHDFWHHFGDRVGTLSCDLGITLGVELGHVLVSSGVSVGASLGVNLGTLFGEGGGLPKRGPWVLHSKLICLCRLLQHSGWGT